MANVALKLKTQKLKDPIFYNCIHSSTQRHIFSFNIPSTISVSSLVSFLMQNDKTEPNVNTLQVAQATPEVFPGTH